MHITIVMQCIAIHARTFVAALYERLERAVYLKTSARDITYLDNSSSSKAALISLSLIVVHAAKFRTISNNPK